MGPVVLPVRGFVATALTVVVLLASRSARADEPVPMTPGPEAAPTAHAWTPMPPASHTETRRNGVFTAGVIVTIAGGLQIPAGIGFFAAGQPGECEVFEAKRTLAKAPFFGGCSGTTGAETFGIGMIVTGITGVLTGAFMMALGRSRVVPAGEELALTPTITASPHGGALRWSF